MTKLHLAIATMIAALLVAAPASAQRGGSSTASTYTGGGNTALPSLDQDNPKLHFDQGVAALQIKDYDRAVSEFREVIRRDQRNSAANYMIGLAFIGKNDLELARKHLRIAAKSNAPEPKGRLGWVEAKLGNAAGAKDQRDDLAKLEVACKSSCPEAAAITSSLAMIDAAAGSAN